MKILMLNNEFPPLGGGTGTVNKEILQQLAKHTNIEVDLVTSNRENKNVTQQFSANIRIFKKALNNQNIHHSSNSELIKYTIKAIVASVRLQKKNKYNLVMAWSTVPAGFVALVFHIFFKTPFIVRVGGTDIPGFEERYNFIYKIITPLIKFIWKKAVLIVAKCETEKRMILALTPVLNLRVIHNGIDIQKFKPTPHQQNKHLTLICSARLIKRKGIDTLIDAIALLTTENKFFRVLLVGEGDEKQNLMQQVKNLKLENNVQFLGYVPREKMPETYAQAHVFVLPSHNEGMSNALLEGLACGLPAVVTSVGGTEELIVENHNGFIFEAGNANQLAEKLWYISENKEKIANWSENARKTAEQKNWHTITNQYLLLLEKYAHKT